VHSIMIVVLRNMSAPGLDPDTGRIVTWDHSTHIIEHENS
jgi:hypothetical protein